MKFSYNWLKEYISDISDPKRLVGNLTMRAFEVEEIDQLANDFILDIKVLPNRAFDCFSYLGIAREIAAIENIKFQEPEFTIKEDKSFKIKDFLSVEVKEPEFCPRYSARVVVNIKVSDSPAWLKEKLVACGLRPINNIVDITNFTMLESGQPLHAFDLDKIESVNPKSQNPNSNDQIKKIIVRRAEKGEKIITLDEGKAERILNENILVIADEKKPMAIAGIKGGRGPEIDDSTKRVVIEAANFEPQNIRKSSKALNLRTDASMRFENGVDLNLTLWALNRAAGLMAEIANGQVANGVVDEVAIKRQVQNTGVSHSYIESLLGMSVKSSEVLEIFERLGLSSEAIKKNNEIFYEMAVPSRRDDLNTQEDLIEEVGRLMGYENIAPKMPEGSILSALKDEDLIYAEEICDILAGLGFMEVYNYSFVGESEASLFKFKNLIEVKNPMSLDQKYLRPNLATGLLNDFKENLKYFHSSIAKNRSLRLFEIGQVFTQSGSAVVEAKKIGGLIYLKGGQKNQAFYELKGLLEIMFGKLSLAGTWEDDHLAKGLPDNLAGVFNLKKTAQIKVEGKLVGWLGAFNRQLLEGLEIGNEPIIFEIDFRALVGLTANERKYLPPSQFPAVTRDLSVLVDAEVKIDRVESEINSAGGKLLQNLDLFDLYEGEDLADEQKSLAFHLIFQSNERNLSDSEINKIMEKIIKAIGERGWEVRKFKI